MIRKYSEYINEAYVGKNPSPHELYWDNSTFKKIFENEWSQISTSRYESNIYSINFRAGDEQYDYYSVLAESNGNIDIYYLEDSDKVKISKDFEKKFVEEFFKNGHEYYKDLTYTPKCLGDISYLADADKYNV